MISNFVKNRKEAKSESKYTKSRLEALKKFNIGSLLLNYYYNFYRYMNDEDVIYDLEQISNEGNIIYNFFLGSMYVKVRDEKKASILFTKIFHTCFSLAKNGDCESQYYLSLMYYFGYGINKDLEKAFKWCKKSVEQGYDEALFMLATMYINDKSSKESNKEDDLVIACYRSLAEKGNIEAQKKLADIYFIKREYQEAFYWYAEIDKQEDFNFETITKFAEKGNIEAQKELAERYFRADGVEKDYNKAIYWLSKVAEQGDCTAQLQLAESYVCYKEGQDKSIYWYSKAAELGNSVAQYMLGQIYRLKKDYDKSIYWFSKAAELGDYGAQCSLGKLYKDCIKDYDKSIYWFSKATEHEVGFDEFKVKSAQIQLGEIKEFLNLRDKANKGDLDSQLSIVKLFVKGFGIEADYKKALEWYWDLLGNGNLQVLYNLGLMHEFGLGTEQDFKKALDFYYKYLKKGNNNAKERLYLIKEFLENKKLAENGNSTAQLKLAKMYLSNDNGLGRDYKRAIYWLSEAGTNGNVNEANMLNEIYIMLCRIYSGELLDDEDIFFEIIDIDKAIYWYEKAAELGDKLIQSDLGFFYELKGDYSKAIYWYEKSAIQGENRAQYNLGLIYKDNKDYEKALMWFEKYAEQHKIVEEQYKISEKKW